MKLTEIAEEIQRKRPLYPCERGAKCQFLIDTGVSKMCTYGCGCVVQRPDYAKWIGREKKCGNLGK